jgi:hypothetical protein
MSALASAVNEATDATETLRCRMHHAVELYQLVEDVRTVDAIEIVSAELHLVIKLADALVHTAYFPLQELFYRCLSKLLQPLWSSELDKARMALHRFSTHWHRLDLALSAALPLDHLIKSVCLNEERCP